MHKVIKLNHFHLFVCNFVVHSSIAFLAFLCGALARELDIWVDSYRLLGICCQRRPEEIQLNGPGLQDDNVDWRKEAIILH